MCNECKGVNQRCSCQCGQVGHNGENGHWLSRDDTGIICEGEAGCQHYISFELGKAKEDE